LQNENKWEKEITVAQNTYYPGKGQTRLPVPC